MSIVKRLSYAERNIFLMQVCYIAEDDFLCIIRSVKVG